MGTQFSTVYNRFLGKITDDLYMELTPEDTIRDLQNLLINAIPGFEFPRKNLMLYTIQTKQVDKEEVTEDDFTLGMDFSTEKMVVEKSCFEAELTEEEINILAILMMANWLQRQVTSIENIRMKYSGADFKMTSQANHLQKLIALQSDVDQQSLHLQRLYKRRVTSTDGNYKSNWFIFGQDFKNGN